MSRDTRQARGHAGIIVPKCTKYLSKRRRNDEVIFFLSTMYIVCVCAALSLSLSFSHSLAL